MTRTIHWRSLRPDECTAKVGRVRLYVLGHAWEAYCDSRLIAEGAEGSLIEACVAAGRAAELAVN